MVLAVQRLLPVSVSPNIISPSNAVSSAIATPPSIGVDTDVCASPAMATLSLPFSLTSTDRLSRFPMILSNPSSLGTSSANLHRAFRCIDSSGASSSSSVHLSHSNARAFGTEVQYKANSFFVKGGLELRVLNRVPEFYKTVACKRVLFSRRRRHGKSRSLAA